MFLKGVYEDGEKKIKCASKHSKLADFRETNVQLPCPV